MTFSLSGTDQLPYSTVRIVGRGPDGDSVGTAFFFDFKTTDDKIVLCLISNKHVVKGCTTGEFFVHTAKQDSNGELIGIGVSIPIALSGFESLWIGHPDPLVDLCAMPFGPLMNSAKDSGKEIFKVALDDSIIPAYFTNIILRAKNSHF